MTAYSIVRWESFFVAEVGATAALTGLLFVAVSINLQQILAYAWLPGRAAQTLLILGTIMFAATLGLVPGQSSRVLGVEIAVVAAVAWFAAMRSHWKARTEQARVATWPRWWAVVGIQLALVPFIVCGVSLLARWGGGLYWLVPGVVLALVVALSNAWVLLVEIVR